MKTHFKCLKCEKYQPRYFFKQNHKGHLSCKSCNPCLAKAAKAKYEKEVKGFSDIVDESNSICLGCKKPMDKDIKGGYHVSCRKKRNAKTDTGVML